MTLYPSMTNRCAMEQVGKNHELATVAEAAAEFRVSEGALRAWIKNGRLLVVRLPSGRIRVPRAVIESLKAPTPAGGV